MTEEDLKNYAELAERITQALYIIQNKGKVPYTAYQGAKNFCIATIISYRDGIVKMLEEATADKKAEEAEKTEDAEAV